MRLTALVTVVLVLALAVVGSPADGCTSFLVKHPDGPVMAKNYDWDVGAGMLVVNPRGLAKSSLVDELARRALHDAPDRTLAVLCADPTKRKTGGALLGDRTRLANYYIALEGYHAAGYRGFGSMGADYWNVLGKDAKHRNPYSKAANIIGRYVESLDRFPYFVRVPDFEVTAREDIRPEVEVKLLVNRVLASPVHHHFTEGAPGLKECAVFGRALRMAALTAALALQVGINMGVALGLLPTKGLTLPFMSYGGNSIIVGMLVIAMLQRIHLEHAPEKRREGGAWRTSS